MFLLRVSLLLFSAQICVGCQIPGNALCWLFDYDLVVGEGCCGGSYCFPYPYDGGKDSFCQFIERLKEGAFCGNRIGICEDGLTCDLVATVPTCKKNTAATTATTPAVIITTPVDNGSCQKPGQALCYLAEYEVSVGNPCCADADCVVYPGDASGDKFCQFKDPIEEGDFCGNMVGVCAEGFTCSSNICTASAANCALLDVVCYSPTTVPIGCCDPTNKCLTDPSNTNRFTCQVQRDDCAATDTPCFLPDVDPPFVTTCCDPSEKCLPRPPLTEDFIMSFTCQGSCATNNEVCFSTTVLKDCCPGLTCTDDGKPSTTNTYTCK